MRTILLIFIVASAVSSYAYDEQSISFPDSNAQTEFIKILESKGIKFEVRNNSIYYDIVNEKEIKDLSRRFIYDDLPSDRSISVASKKQRNCLIERLKKEQVNYVIEERHGEKWIVTENYSLDQMRAIFKAHCMEPRIR